MKVLVCGSRTWTDWGTIHSVLDDLRSEIGDFTVIEGDARGADRVAGRWADSRGLPVETYPAQWSKYGKRAGYVRNQQMLDEGKPDMVVAFMIGESRGTTMMIELAAKAGVRVMVRGG